MFGVQLREIKGTWIDFELLNLTYVGTNLYNLMTVVTNFVFPLTISVIPLWTVKWTLNIFIFGLIYYFSINAKLTRRCCQMIIFIFNTIFSFAKTFETYFRICFFIIEHIIVASYFYTIIVVNAGC